MLHCYRCFAVLILKRYCGLEYVHLSLFHPSHYDGFCVPSQLPLNERRFVGGNWEFIHSFHVVVNGSWSKYQYWNLNKFFDCLHNKVVVVARSHSFGVADLIEISSHSNQHRYLNCYCHLYFSCSDHHVLRV